MMFEFTRRFDADEGAGGGTAGTGEKDPPAEPPAQTDPPEGKGGGRADARIAEAVAAKKEAEERAAEAEKKLKEREDADLSEKEKAEKERDDARKEAAEATAKATKLERGTWARSAAVEANALDSDAVTALLGDLTEEKYDSETKVKNAISKLVEAKPKLFAEKPQAGMGTLTGGSLPAPRPGEAPAGEDSGGGDPEDEHKLGLGRDLAQHLRRNVG